MKEFMGRDFLLTTRWAEKLYHTYAEHMPILDYHCHISAKEIAEDKNLKRSRRSGWEEIIINGARCGQTG